MHEDDSAGGESPASPAGPSDDSTLPAGPGEASTLPAGPGEDSTLQAGLPGDFTAPAGSPRTVAPTARFRARSASWARALLIYLVVAALAAAAGVGSTLAVQHATAARPGASRTPRDAAADQPGAMNDEAVYDEVEPGIVDVTSNLRYLQETAEGTGFVIDAAAGLVLTNNHVIDGATNVTVTPVLSGKSYPARVLGYDRTDDVALLQVQGATGLRAVTLGDSSHVRVGTPVLAIGNEAGQGGSPTVAPGVISSLDRTIVANDQSSGLIETLHGMMQTNADIRPGDSGGPLADAAGRVIGINTAAGGSTVYSGYAIPINQAVPIARRIEAGQPGARIQIGLPASLGVLLPDSTSADPRHQASQELRQTGTVSSSGSGCSSGDTTAVPGRIAPARSGALVDGVLCGTPAATAGLSAGDVITSLGGKAVTSPGSLTVIVSRYRPGSKAPLAWVSPGGSRHTAVVTLDAGPAG
ncbi:MAG: S1C family serine protease [Streptosporangiaceae bacterium]